MSADNDHSLSFEQKKDKKVKGKDKSAGGKKRKRQIIDEPEPASPTKKQKSQRSNFAQKKKIEDISTKSSVPSSIYQQKSSFYLPLPPISQRHSLRGLCAEYLSPLILTYYPPLRGVILSYSEARLGTDPEHASEPTYARAMDEYAATLVWLTADFVIFRPQKGDVMEGWVNLQNESNIGLLCLNFFNATIDRKRLSKEWKWISPKIRPTHKKKLKPPAEDASETSDDSDENLESIKETDLQDTQGYFQDGKGKRVEGIIRFRVRNVESSKNMDRDNGFLNIEGTMLTQAEEKEVDARGQENLQRSRRVRKQDHVSGHITPEAQQVEDISTEVTPISNAIVRS